MTPSSSSHVHNLADVLCCLNCGSVFSRDRLPVNLNSECGGAVCSYCIKNGADNQNGKIKIPKDSDRFPINLAFMKILGIHHSGLEGLSLADRLGNAKFASEAAELEEILVELSSYLRGMKAERGTTLSSDCLSRLVQRKLVSILTVQFSTDEGRSNGFKLARSLIERIVTELVLNLQNSAHVSSYLWSAVRARGCQFLGPAMQEDVLRLILLALMKGELIARKTLVLYIVQTMEPDFPHVSKTCVGHVVQLLYRASCFNVIKREGESSLMQLKEEFRDYDKLRREHDTQIVQIALEAGLHISAEQWSSLLYGDMNHRTYIETIMDSLQSLQLLKVAVVELRGLLNRNGDPDNLTEVLPEISDIIQMEVDEASINFALLREIFSSIRKMMSAYARFNKAKILDCKYGRKNEMKSTGASNGQRMYKTRLCRDILYGRPCPRADRCTYAHANEELRLTNGKTPDVQHTNNSYAPSEIQFVSTMPPVGRTDVVNPPPMMIDPTMQSMIPMVPVMIQPTPDGPMEQKVLNHPAMNPNAMFMFQPTEPPPAPILIPPPNPTLAANGNRMDPYGGPKPTVFIPMGPPPTVTLVPGAKPQAACPPMNSYLFGPAVTQVVMFQESLNGRSPNYSNGNPAAVRAQNGDYNELNGGKIPSSAWDNNLDDQHLLMRRHEIVTRLAQMRVDPVAREDCDEDVTSHVSYTVASSVLFDELDAAPGCMSLELPPMPAVHSLPLSFPDSVLSPRCTVPFGGVSDMCLGRSPINNHPPHPNLLNVQQPASTSARLWSSVRTACPTTFLHGESTAPAMVQAECGQMRVTGMLERPLVIASIQRQNLSPQMSYEAVDPMNMVDHVPQVIRPLPLDNNPQHLVAATLDRILNVKERILDVNMKGGPASAVEKAQLNVELNIVNRQISTLDNQTKTSCLLKELEAVDKKIDEMNVAV